MEQIEKFIVNTVGDKAALYLSSRYDKRALPHYMLLYWLANNVRHQFSGKVPGFEDSILTVQRNSNGKYDGHLMINDINLDFVNNSILDINATIAICLDFDEVEISNTEPEMSNLISSLILGYKQRFDSNVFKIKMEPNEVHVECDLCGKNLFRNGAFTGCLCFSSEGTRTIHQNNLVTILLEKETWDFEAYSVLLQMLKR